MKDGQQEGAALLTAAPPPSASRGISDILTEAPSITRWTRRQGLMIMVAIGDGAMILGSAALVPRVIGPGPATDTPWTAGTLMPVAILAAILLIGGMSGARRYGFPVLSRTLYSVATLLAAWGLCLIGLMALGYLFGLHKDYPRTLTLPWATAAAVLMGGVHLVGAQAIRWCARKGIFRQRIAVVGATPRVLDLLTSFSEQTRQTDYDVVGIFDDRIARVPKMVGGIPVVGTVADLLTRCKQQLVDVIVITLPWAAEARNSAIIRDLRELPVDISLVPDLDTTLLPPRGILWLGRMPTVLVSRRPLSDRQMLLKWAEDKVIALIALLLLSPVMIGAALAVKLTSPGPLFFRQKRFGFNQKAIDVLKFRTMYADRGDPTGRQRTVKDDPRITPVGRFLRKTSIDELPQLLNVLMGDMSIIGPRAHAVAMAVGGRYYHEAVAEYQSRHRVRPGITGWAQVNGSRGEVETQAQAEERLRLDIYYVDNWSLALDLRIMIRTLKVLFNDPQAY